MDYIIYLSKAKKTYVPCIIDGLELRKLGRSSPEQASTVPALLYSLAQPRD